MKYTAKDHVTLTMLWKFSGYELPPFSIAPSNAQVASWLNVGTSGAASRLRRLENLDVIDFVYEATPEMGRVITRTIYVKRIPQPPWE